MIDEITAQKYMDGLDVAAGEERKRMEMVPKKRQPGKRSAFDTTKLGPTF